MDVVYEHTIIAPAASRRLYSVLKRTFDLLTSLLLLVLVTPLLLICAIAIRIESPGPVLFRQQRVGECGRLFWMLKLRSMRADSSPEIHASYVAEFIKGSGQPVGGSNGAIYKLADPRVTRVGEWLRKSSLDELPQLWNVLRGEMSLVGPRPPIPYELKHYTDRDFDRLAVKPGITGLWQVSGRNRTTFQRMVELDLDYIHRRSILLDLQILVRTVPVVLLRNDAR